MGYKTIKSSDVLGDVFIGNCQCNNFSFTFHRERPTVLCAMGRIFTIYHSY